MRKQSTPSIQHLQVIASEIKLERKKNEMSINVKGESESENGQINGVTQRTSTHTHT